MVCFSLIFHLLFLHSRTICSHILEQVGDRVSLRLELAGIKRDSSRRLRPDTRRVVDVIGRKARLLKLLGAKTLGELSDDRTDHLQMCQLLRADVGQKSCDLSVWHRIALGEVAEGCGSFAVGTSEWL